MPHETQQTEPRRNVYGLTEEQYQVLRQRFKNAQDDVDEREDVVNEIACGLLTNIRDFASKKVGSSSYLLTTGTIVQRSYLKLFKYLPQNANALDHYESLESLIRLIQAIVSHAISEKIRSETRVVDGDRAPRHGVRFPTDEGGQPLPQPSKKDEFEEFVRNDVAQKFWELLQTVLEPNQIELLVKRYFEEKTYEEIAEEYGEDKGCANKYRMQCARLLASLVKSPPTAVREFVASNELEGNLWLDAKSTLVQKLKQKFGVAAAALLAEPTICDSLNRKSYVEIMELVRNVKDCGDLNDFKTIFAA